MAETKDSFSKSMTDIDLALENYIRSGCRPRRVAGDLDELDPCWAADTD